ncbi:unnamed protein product [Victoria cruziana]
MLLLSLIQGPSTLDATTSTGRRHEQLRWSIIIGGGVGARFSSGGAKVIGSRTVAGPGGGGAADAEGEWVGDGSVVIAESVVGENGDKERCARSFRLAGEASGSVGGRHGVESAADRGGALAAMARIGGGIHGR